MMCCSPESRLVQTLLSSHAAASAHVPTRHMGSDVLIGVSTSTPGARSHERRLALRLDSPEHSRVQAVRTLRHSPSTTDALRKEEAITRRLHYILDVVFSTK